MPRKSFDSEYVYWLQRRVRELERMVFDAGTQGAEPYDRDYARLVTSKGQYSGRVYGTITKPKRKPSKYNLFVKAKSKGQKFKYQSGKDKGKLNMRKIGIAWRKTRR